MPDTTYGRAVSLAWTGGSATSPLPNIQSYNFNQTKELVDFLNGNARVKSFYSATEDAVISVTTKDIGSARLFAQGEYVTSLILTLEGATQSDGTAASSYKITFSKAIVNSGKSIEHGNEDSAPAIYTVEFRLARKEADSADPTVTFSAVT